MMFILEEFEKQLAKDVRDDNINGSISAAVVHKDKIIWSKAFGPSDTSGHFLADVHTLYRAGSIAKSITAFLMMQLVQAGTIGLDDPVEKYFPNVRELEGYSDSTRITFRQLASHTAGLIREPKLENADSGPIDEWENRVLQSIPKTSFESKPGKQFSYSNIGYGILGAALSYAANEPLIEMIEKRIFELLGMENSFFIVPEHKRKNLAQGIGGGPFGGDELDVEGPQKEHVGRGYKVPNGGLYSTPTDLGKFVAGNLGQMDLLDSEHLEILHARQTPETGYRGYGLGFERYEDRTMTILGHSGGVLGYSANMIFEKQHQYGVILMRNYNWGTTSWDIGPMVLLRKLVELEKRESLTPL